ncbi:hypothetical protein HDV06_004811 [Boothiomyces sp. JEL0866]|nr:hypothetical protein HDV06_004811 [Boothiomyces sp. JEL0866]
MTSHSALKSKPIIERILLYSANLRDLTIVNKQWYEISKSLEFRKEWLEWNKAILEEWITDIKETFGENDPFADCKSYIANKCFPEVCGRKAVNAILKDPNLVLAIATSSNLFSVDFAFWCNYMLSRGSLSGIKYLVDHQEPLPHDLINNSLFALISNQSELALQVLRQYGSSLKQNLLQDAIKYCCTNCNSHYSLTYLKVLLPLLEIKECLFFCLVYAERNNYSEIIDILLDACDTAVQEAFSNFQNIHRYLVIGQPDQAVLLLKEFKNPDNLVESWYQSLALSIRAQNTTNVQFLLNFASQHVEIISIPLKFFFDAIDVGKKELVGLILPHLELISVRNGDNLERVNSILDYVCTTPKYELCRRLYPFSNTTDVQQLTKFVTERQICCFQNLFQYARNLNKGFELKAENIWKAVELGNNELVEAMQKVGVELKWMDGLKNSNASIEVTNTVVRKEVSLDSASLAMFNAYGGQILTVSESQKDLYKPEAKLKAKAIFGHGCSFQKSKGDSPIISPTSASRPNNLTSIDLSGSFGNLRKKTRSFILASSDGKKTYRAAPRTQTVNQATKSNRIWESYLSGSQVGLVTESSSPVNWMENATNEKSSKAEESTNMERVPSIIQALAGLY